MTLTKRASETRAAAIFDPYVLPPTPRWEEAYTRGPGIGEVFGLPNEALKFLVPPENRAVREITPAVSSSSGDFRILGAEAREGGRRTYTEKGNEEDTLLKANIPLYRRAEKPKIIPRFARCLESTLVYITRVRLCNVSWTGRYAMAE